MSDETTTTTETTTEAAPMDIAAAAEAVFGTAPEAPKEAPAEAAPEPEAPKPAEDDRVAARIAAAKRAELRAAKEREAIAAARAEVERSKAEVAELAKLAETLKAAKASPSKALELLGFDAKTFLETLATENEPGSIAAREVAKEREEREKLRAELDELRSSLKEAEAAKARQEQETKRAVAEQEFIALVEKNTEKYPHLVEEFTPTEILRESARILHEVVGHDERGRPVSRLQAFYAEHGDYPSDEDIAEYLESQAQARAKARSEWKARIGKSAPAVPPSEGVPSGDLRQAQPDRGQSPRTLTSRAASEKATAPKPWSQEAADEESIRILAAALKAG